MGNKSRAAPMAGRRLMLAVAITVFALATTTGSLVVLLGERSAAASAPTRAQPLSGLERFARIKELKAELRAIMGLRQPTGGPGFERFARIKEVQAEAREPIALSPQLGRSGGRLTQLLPTQTPLHRVTRRGEAQLRSLKLRCR